MSSEKNNPYVGSTFRGANTDILKGTKQGGYRAGTIGVSDFQGKILNYKRHGKQALHGGAGVSVMTSKPVSRGLLNPQSYSLYGKTTESNLYDNMYRGRKK